MPPIPGIISSGIIFLFTYMYTQYLLYIHSPKPSYIIVPLPKIHLIAFRKKNPFPLTLNSRFFTILLILSSLSLFSHPPHKVLLTNFHHFLSMTYPCSGSSWYSTWSMSLSPDPSKLLLSV
jgi:hypothetical protein